MPRDLFRELGVEPGGGGASPSGLQAAGRNLFQEFGIEAQPGGAEPRNLFVELGVQSNLDKAVGDLRQTMTRATDTPRDRTFMDDIEIPVGGQATPIDLTKPVIRNPDGSISTEETMTVEREGRWHLVPTIISGRRVSEDQAIAEWRSGRHRDVGSFASQGDADTYARARSQRIGELTRATRPATGFRTRGGQFVLTEPEQFRDPFDRDVQGEQRAPWTGEGGVLESLPAQMVAGTRNAVANLKRMMAEESAAQRRSVGPAVGETPAGAVTGRAAPGSIERQRSLLVQDEAAVEAAAREAVQARSDLQLVTPHGMDVAQQAVSSLAQSAPPTALGIAVGILTRNPALAMTIAGGGGGAIQGGSTYGEARERGAPHRLSATAATIDAILEGVGEALPLRIALKLGSPIIARIVNTIAAESGQEAVTQAAQDLRAMAMENPDLSFNEAWHNLKVAALAGAMGGAAYGGAGAAADASRRSPRAAAPAGPEPGRDLFSESGVEPPAPAGAEIPSAVAPVATMREGQPPSKPPAGVSERRAEPRMPDVNALRAQLAETNAQRTAITNDPARAQETRALNDRAARITNQLGELERNAQAAEQLLREHGYGRPARAAASAQSTAPATAVDAAAHEAATSTTNDLAQPSSAQIDAGNFQKGHATIAGLAISIEHPRGAVRSGKDGSWKRRLDDHYGYVKDVPARGPDKEHIDVYVKPGTATAFDGDVFVVDQVKQDGRFDEPKVMIGYASEADARKGYLRNYPPGWKGLGGVTRVSMPDFKAMLEKPEAFKKPLAMPAKAAPGLLTERAEQPKPGQRVRVVEGPASIRGKIGELRSGGLIALDDGTVYAHGPDARFEVLPTRPETAEVPATLGATAVARRAYAPTAQAESAVDAEKARPDVIRRALRDLFNVPINERGVTVRRAAGIYKVKPQTIRVRNQNDIDVIAHEVGHHFSERNQKVRDLMRQHQTELLAITPDAYAKEPLALRREEGFAEFVRLYLTQKAEASRRAPGFMKDFDAFIDASKKYRPIFNEVQGMIDAWFNLDPVDRIMAKVGAEPRGLLDRLRENFGADRLIFEALDNWHPLKLMVRDLNPSIQAIEDPFKAAHLLSGDAAIIEDWLVSGTVPYDPALRADPKNYGKPLHDIMKPVAKDLRRFSAYLIAKRAQELQARGKERLFTDEEIKAGLALETPAFKAAAAEIYKYNDDLIDYAVEGGLLSQEAAAKFREYTAYIPFFRESEDGAGGRGRGGVFQRLRGGTSNVRDPISNMIQNTANIVHATNRNAVLAKAYQLAQSVPGGGRWIEAIPMPKKAVQVTTERILEELSRQGLKIDTEMAEDLAAMQTFFQPNVLGDERHRITVVKIGGEPKALQVNHKLLWQALQAFEPVDLGIIGTVLAVPSDLLRAGVTLSPDFMARNFMRDTLSGFIQSKRGLKPLLSTIGGFKEVGTRSDAYRLYRAFGGAYADLWKGESEQTQRALERMAKRGKWDPRTILSPSGMIEVLHRLGSASEAGTRVAEFKKTATKGDINSLIDAAYNAREVSVDFGLHGHNKAVRMLTRITPFLNPALQGFYKMGRTGRERFFTTVLRGSVLAAFSIALFLRNKDEDWYDKLEDWEKNVYWHFDVGLRDDEGRVIPLRVPKPFEWGAVFGSVPEALTQVAIDKGGKEFGKRLASVLEDNFTLRAMPTAFLVPAEQWANKVTFTDRPIVPESKERLDPELQYGPGTSLTAREAGKAAGMSPARIDHLVRGFLGTLGVPYGVMLADQMLRAAGDYPVAPETTWRRWPVVRAFVHDPDNPNSRYVNEFYELLQKARRADASLKHYEDEAADTYQEKHEQALDFARTGSQLADAMAKLRRESEDIAESRDYTAQEKRRLIRDNSALIRMIAKEGVRAGQP